MASKRKVTQNDLRKLMAEAKSGTSIAKGSSAMPKKLKLSARELALIEEQKRQKALRDQEKIRLKQEKEARVVPNKNLQPKKSILKNNSSSNYVPPQMYIPNTTAQKQPATPANVTSTSLMTEAPSSRTAATTTSSSHSKHTTSTSSAKAASAASSEVAPQDTDSSTLPEGFFDDPKMDAKVRQLSIGS